MNRTTPSNVTRLADRRPSAGRPNTGRPASARPTVQRATAGRQAAATRDRLPIGDRLANTGQTIMRFIERVFGGQSMLFLLTAGVAVVLAIFGLIMVLSASSIASIRETGGPFSYAWRQLLFVVIGIVVLMFASVLPLNTYLRFSGMFFALMLALQLIAATIGSNINGNREWIQLGPFSLQPGEFLKLAVVLTMATHFHRYQGYEWDYKNFGWRALVFPALAGFFIIIGSDMGTTMVLGIIALLMLWLSEVEGKGMRLPVLIAVVGVIGGLMSSSSRRARITAWLDPGTSDQANTLVWQSMHGIWALANSNGIGRGLGMSNLKWSWIPEVQNDYIFAVIGEELGILGALATVVLFIFLGYLILRIAARAGDLFSKMVCYGVAAWIVVQAIINISVVLTILPVLGVPLPLISYGGSSLIAGMAAIGVVLSIERTNHEQLDHGSRRPVKARR